MAWTLVKHKIINRIRNEEKQSQKNVIKINTPKGFRHMLTRYQEDEFNEIEI